MLSTRRPPRRGLTLVELLVATALFGVIAGALLLLVARAEREAGRIGARAGARRATRDAASGLAHALRELAPGSGDLLVAGAGEVQLRATVAVSVLCGIDAARSTVVIVPPAGAGPALGSWLTAPRIADTVLFWAEMSGTTEDSLVPASPGWRVSVLDADAASGATCDPAAGVAAVVAPGSAVALRLATPLSDVVALGAPVRVVRRMRWALYRGGDGRWYLGVSDCVPARATPCATIQPVSGPYPAAGVTLAYLDSTGNVAVDSARAARIEITARADGAPWPAAADTVVVSVSPRG